MNDDDALWIALRTACSFFSGRLNALEAARTMTGIVNPGRSWWSDLGGAGGPLAIFYGAGSDELFAPDPDIDRWEPAVREACDRLVAYSGGRDFG